MKTQIIDPETNQIMRDELVEFHLRNSTFCNEPCEDCPLRGVCSLGREED